MKLVAASDIHIEFPATNFGRAIAFPDATDVIVLAGDIEVGNVASEEILDIARRFPSAQIVWVAGNHEFYEHNIDSQINHYREACRTAERVHFLENESVQIGSVKFIGCTLWTDFTILGDKKRAMEVSERIITDFSLIKTRDGEWFTPQDAADRFEESCRYLEAELSSSDPESTVVITHFPPGLETRNQNFGMEAITAYFQANVDHIIDRYQPAVWVYGHNHYSNDLRRGKTRLVSNQLGYPSESGRIPSYNARKVINLNSERDKG